MTVNPTNQQEDRRRADHLSQLLAMVLEEQDDQHVLSPDELRGRLLTALLHEPSPIGTDGRDVSLRAVLLGGGASADELEAVKAFAKERAGGAGPAQRDVLFVLYLLAIASALVHTGQRITQHGMEELSRMCATQADLPWLDEEVRTLLARGVECSSQQGTDAAATSESSRRLALRVTVDGRQVDFRTLRSREGQAVLGRSGQADVQLDSDRIAPRHATVWFDGETGEWTIAAVGDATFQVNGRPARGPIPFEGVPVELGPFRLEAMRDETTDKEQAEPATVEMRLAEGEDSDLLASRTDRATALGEDAVRRLNLFGQAIMGVGTPEELYGAACAAMAEREGDWSGILRIRTDSPAEAPEASLLVSSDSSAQGPGRGRRLSRTVISAVCREGRASIARSAPRGRDQLQLSMSDASGPRVVACVPLETREGEMDALYLDCPEIGRTQSLAESLDYLESVARMLRLARTNLVAARAQARWEARERELRLAQEIQKTLLPRDLHAHEGFEMALLYEPVAWVGGDYCDVWPLPDGRIGFAVADVAGKGIPASLVMSGLHAALRAVTAVCDAPEVVAERTNEYICHHTPEGMLVTIIVAFCDPGSGVIEYVNAGHEPPIRLDTDGRARRVADGSDLLMGLQPTGFTRRSLTLDPGQTLLLVTDGLTESGPSRQEMFGWQGVCAAAEGFGGSAMDLARRVVDEARGRSGSELFRDDATVFVVRRTGA
jgi:serine phosphatase RsbU (regulator of sigma subunit)